MIILAGVVTALAFIFLLLKCPIRRLLAFDFAIDVGVTALMMVMFAGTFAGMFAAVTGGAIVSVFLYATKQLIGYEKPHLRWLGLRGVRWERRDPRWKGRLA